MRFSTAISPVIIALSTTISLVSAGPISPVIVAPSTTISLVSAEPNAYGICQTDCNTVAVACYAGAGATFGTVVADADTPPAILACNAALGTCSAACASATLLAPTPDSGIAEAATDKPEGLP